MTSRPVLPGWPPASPAFCATALPAEARISPIGTLVPCGVIATDAATPPRRRAGPPAARPPPPPQREDRVEELGHLHVGNPAQRDAEQAAGVDPVGLRPGAVPTGHWLHDDVEERDRLLAAL